MGRRYGTISAGTGRRAKFFSRSLATGKITTSEPTESELTEHFEFNHLQSVRLPYIEIPEINAKFLVDTGASVSTELGQNHFPEYIRYSPFSVTTMHATTYHDYILEIPSLYTFNAYGQIHTFNIMNFSKKYDGILGLKIMKQMEAVIDFNNKILKTKFTEIPLHFDDPSIKLGPEKDE
ncbi:hypothetical protein QE152_g1902 [Popillia japonica]|uniref:Peptidase A2 domain-containing protein n=1 Tax=Popillia japonica TaxID=7064 RepID=A0AAW1N3Y4_POPJA